MQIRKIQRKKKENNINIMSNLFFMKEKEMGNKGIKKISKETKLLIEKVIFKTENIKSTIKIFINNVFFLKTSLKIFIEDATNNIR